MKDYTKDINRIWKITRRVETESERLHREWKENMKNYTESRKRIWKITQRVEREYERLHGE